ncbi:MAG: ASPIC/UnbV domain-containing protein, partial [Verrucomicrobiales bacterium]|nr:ASPIC/UnbV domain-containing protein [Verrucomicrobiales bacterium]
MLAYDSAWSALNKMIRAGKPFSGGERNCSYLNLGAVGEPQFANISSAAALDFQDDGRGLATTDWDLDGDIDFFITNRTGPRVRFVRNDSPHPDTARWVAFELNGTKSNRDAVGARVEVHLPGGAKRIKSIYAGNSYISQSSKSLHFGIGNAQRIEKVVVRWPGSTSQVFSDISPGIRYTLTEGSPAAKKAGSPPTAPPLESSIAKGNPESDAGRIILLDPPAIGSLTAKSLTDGSPIDLNSSGKPLLLNLWATWCVPCLAEMKEWGEARESL